MKEFLWIVTGYLVSVSLNYFLFKMNIRQRKSVSKEELYLSTSVMFMPVFNLIMLMLTFLDVLGRQLDTYFEKRKQNKIKMEKPSYLEHFYGVEKQEVLGEVRYASKKKRGY